MNEKNNTGEFGIKRHSWLGRDIVKSAEEKFWNQPKREEPERPQPEREESEHPTPEWEEPERPTPAWGEPERPQPKRGESVRPQPKEGGVGASTTLGPKLPAEGECLLVPPPPAEEQCLLSPSTPAEEQGLLSQCTPAEEACLLVHLLLLSQELKGEKPSLPSQEPEGEELQAQPPEFFFGGGRRAGCWCPPAASVFAAEGSTACTSLAATAEGASTATASL
ncbi:UNVERIFIED_CONTAM: hypothetical protein FKN15_063691 [Acipenser sinensis]